MKHFFLLIIGVVFIFGSQNYALGADNCKIGVVNMQKLQEKSKVFQKMKEALKNKFQDLQKKLDNEKSELIKLEEDLKKQGMMLSLDAKEGKQKELKKKSRHYKYLFGEFTQEMKEAELEARKRLGKAIEKEVHKIGKTKAYTLILEKRGVGLLYYSDAVDITDEVIKAYDKTQQ